MKEYQLYRNPAGQYHPVVLMSDYASDFDHQTRYIVLRPYDGRRLLSPVIVSPEEFDTYETLGMVTVYPEEDLVAKTSEAFLAYLIGKTKTGKITIDVNYTKEGQTITVNGAMDVNEILRQIL